MTEEIINTCEYYKICESACSGTLEDTELCSCYQLFKQLQRLEQENKELKEKIKKYSAINEQDTKDYVELKRENVRLFNELIELRAKNIEYKHTLEEINKIAEPRFVNGLNEEADLCNLTMDRIQNRINEVLQ